MYEAMARRYRPATFEEVIGQEHVARTLRNAILADRVAHAYLFCGPHGCGKTTMARIFSAALVCRDGPTPHPCGTCSLCQDVLRGCDVDVLEIDGASNNGVEQVRALREQSVYVPTRARFKIYIIDEVHMLSIAAFNALLKTLEEPPRHVKFILATTDPHKIPETVTSRTQRFDFRLVPPPILAAFFKELVAREKAEIEEEAVEAIAAYAGGSVRDGLVLLDQLLSYAQGKVTREDVERVRGVAPAELVSGLFAAIHAHDLQRALALVEEVAQRGVNVGDFLDQLISFGRDLMWKIATGKEEGISAYGPARTILDQLASSVSLDQSLFILDVLTHARARVRARALSDPLVPLEMAVVRLAGLESLHSMANLLDQLKEWDRHPPLPSSVISPSPSLSNRPAPSPSQEAFEGESTGEKKVAPPSPPSPSAISPSLQKGPEPPSPFLEKKSDDRANTVTPAPPLSENRSLAEIWEAIKKELRTLQPTDLAYLAGVHLARIEDRTLVLSLPGGGAFLFEQIEDSQRKSRIQKAASKILGQEVHIQIELRGPLHPDPASPPPTEKTSEHTRPSLSSELRAHQEVRRDPTLRMILDRFKGQIINIEDEVLPEEG